MAVDVKLVYKTHIYGSRCKTGLLNTSMGVDVKLVYKTHIWQ